MKQAGVQQSVVGYLPVSARCTSKVRPPFLVSRLFSTKPLRENRSFLDDNGSTLPRISNKLLRIYNLRETPFSYRALSPATVFVLRGLLLVDYNPIVRWFLICNPPRG